METKNNTVRKLRVTWTPFVYDFVANPGFSDAMFKSQKEDVIKRRNRLIKIFNMS